MSTPFGRMAVENHKHLKTVLSREKESPFSDRLRMGSLFILYQKVTSAIRIKRKGFKQKHKKATFQKIEM